MPDSVGCFSWSGRPDLNRRPHAPQAWLVDFTSNTAYHLVAENTGCFSSSAIRLPLLSDTEIDGDGAQNWAQSETALLATSERLNG